MKTLITIKTRRKLGGKDVRQILIKTDDAIPVMAKLVSEEKLIACYGEYNSYDDVSGYNFGGSIGTAMLVKAGGVVDNVNIEED